MTNGELVTKMVCAVMQGQTGITIFEQLTEEQKKVLKEKHYKVFWNESQTEISWGKEVRRIYDPDLKWVEEIYIGSKLVDVRLV
jgi:hypothetical protein